MLPIQIQIHSKGKVYSSWKANNTDNFYVEIMQIKPWLLPPLLQMSLQVKGEPSTKKVFSLLCRRTVD